MAIDPKSPFATQIPWVTEVKGSRYGTDHTYQLAGQFLADCQTVADWGGSRGHFLDFLPESCRYTLIDGTKQEVTNLRARDGYVVANLADWREPSQGILLRHVLEMTHDWAAVLENAVASFRHRLVVVTFTPNRRVTAVREQHLTWPCYHFNHQRDLIPRMMPYLKKIDAVKTSHPERVYYLEKP